MLCRELDRFDFEEYQQRHLRKRHVLLSILQRSNDLFAQQYTC